MTRRKTKAQREQEERAALRQRVDDLFAGATGEYWDEECEPWPEDFMSFVRALHLAFFVRPDEDSGEHGNEYLWGLFNLEKYRNPEAAADFLYEHDVRA